ncbi:MAG: thioredoxin family protein [Spirochaetes bacterium]|nr:thioredoxin family protein [Spirochaetota bacterium]MBU0957073.1 thioredoxin family protein [Spirochaetota bacterium]
MKSLNSYEEVTETLNREAAVLLYCSFPSCGVCKSLQPKVQALLTENFPRLAIYYVDIETIPEARGQLSVFSVPAVLVFFAGREYIREARNFGIQDLRAKIERYYRLQFDQSGELPAEG